jgi:hypothetical protein
VSTVELFYCLATDEDDADCSALVYASSPQQAFELWRDDYDWYDQLAATDTGRSYAGPREVRIVAIPLRDQVGVVDWDEVDKKVWVYLRSDDDQGWIEQSTAAEPAQRETLEP